MNASLWPSYYKIRTIQLSEAEQSDHIGSCSAVSTAIQLAVGSCCTTLSPVKIFPHRFLGADFYSKIFVFLLWFRREPKYQNIIKISKSSWASKYQNNGSTTFLRERRHIAKFLKIYKKLIMIQKSWKMHQSWSNTQINILKIFLRQILGTKFQNFTTSDHNLILWL